MKVYILVSNHGLSSNKIVDKFVTLEPNRKTLHVSSSNQITNTESGPTQFPQTNITYPNPLTQRPKVCLGPLIRGLVISSYHSQLSPAPGLLKQNLISVPLAQLLVIEFPMTKSTLLNDISSNKT